MKYFSALILVLFSFMSFSQVSLGFEGGASFNLLQPESVAPTIEPTFGVQALFFNTILTSYSSRNVISVGVLSMGMDKKSGCGKSYEVGLSWGLEGSYSLDQERGGGGVIFTYRPSYRNIFTFKLNTIDGVRVGYLFNL